MNDGSLIANSADLAGSLSQAIAGKKEILLAVMRSEIHKSVSSMDPRDTLSFVLVGRSGKRINIRPEASVRYLNILTNFMRSENYEGSQIESFVTPTAAAAVEKSIIQFYTGPKIAEAIAERLSAHLSVASTARRSVTEQVAAETGRVTRAIIETLPEDLQDRLKHEAIENVNAFFHSAFGHKLMVIVAQAMATTGGKIAMMNVIKVAVANAVASGAFHTLVANLIRKVGISVLIKTAVGKAIVVLMAAVGIAHVPVLWILLPIITGFLIYEYFHFPQKLADRLATAVPDEISHKFDEMNLEIVRGMLPGMVNELRTALTSIGPLEKLP